MTLPADRRIAVVTGASSGIGAATARHLAQAGYHVVTSEDSVAALADLVAELSPRGLDVLVNNAGGAFGATPVAQADSDQWRRMYDVNVLGLMQVTRALLPSRSRPAPARSSTSATPPPSTARRSSPRRCGWSCSTSRCGSLEIAPGMVRTDEFALVRFDGDRAKAEAVYAGVAEPLVADDVADAITFMVTRPPHVNFDEVVIRPRAQAAQHKVHRQA